MTFGRVFMTVFCGKLYVNTAVEINLREKFTMLFAVHLSRREHTPEQNIYANKSIKRTRPILVKIHRNIYSGFTSLNISHMEKYVCESYYELIKTLLFQTTKKYLYVLINRFTQISFILNFN